MACDGSPGVEKTFSIRRVEPSSQTQSVNVPPLSMAILRGFDEGIDFQSSQAEKRESRF
jgi:hypothetical protein